MKWKKARKKPVIVEFRIVEKREFVNTGHGEAFAYPEDDFIIRDIIGEYPIKKEIFYKTYEVIEES